MFGPITLLDDVAHESHRQLCQAIIRHGESILYASGARVVQLDMATPWHRKVLVSVPFLIFSLHMDSGVLGVCGTGFAFCLVDMTGAILVSVGPKNADLTNVIRLFRPPVHRWSVRDEHGEDVEVLEHVCSDWPRDRPLHVLIGSNSAGVNVMEIRDVRTGMAVGQLVEEDCAHFVTVQVAHVPFPTFINEIRVSPDEKQFVALGDSDDIFFVDIAVKGHRVVYERRTKRGFEPPDVTNRPEVGGFAAAWSPNGERVAVLREVPGVVNIVDAESLVVLGVFFGRTHGQELRCLAYSERFLVYSEIGGNLHIVNMHDVTQVQYIDVHGALRQELSTKQEVLHRTVFQEEFVSLLDEARTRAEQHSIASGGVAGDVTDEDVALTALFAATADAQRISRRISTSGARSTGIVILPGTPVRIVAGVRSLVVLTEITQPSLQTLSMQSIVLQRRIWQENVRRIALFKWARRLVLALVRAHNKRAREQLCSKIHDATNVLEGLRTRTPTGRPRRNSFEGLPSSHQMPRPPRRGVRFSGLPMLCTPMAAILLRTEQSRELLSRVSMSYWSLMAPQVARMCDLTSAVLRCVSAIASIVEREQTDVRLAVFADVQFVATPRQPALAHSTDSISDSESNSSCDDASLQDVAVALPSVAPAWTPDRPPDFLSVSKVFEMLPDLDTLPCHDQPLDNLPRHMYRLLDDFAKGDAFTTRTVITEKEPT